MKLKFFFVSVHTPEVAETQVNQFLSSTSVLFVEREFVAIAGQAVGWSICVGCIENQVTSARKSAPSDRIDYREVLSEEDFATFAELRLLRKSVSLELGKPVYQIFSNRQLADMVTKRIRSEAELEKIEGVGESRVKQFGASFIERLLSLQGQGS